MNPFPLILATAPRYHDGVFREGMYTSLGPPKKWGCLVLGGWLLQNMLGPSQWPFNPQFSWELPLMGRLPTPARKYTKWNQGLVALLGTTLLVTIAAFLGLKFTNRHKQVWWSVITITSVAKFGCWFRIESLSYSSTTLGKWPETTKMSWNQRKCSEALETL